MLLSGSVYGYKNLCVRANFGVKVILDGKWAQRSENVSGVDNVAVDW